MQQGRRASDRLTDAIVASSDERGGHDRRALDRRERRWRFDLMFAATLVNQIAPPETEYVRGYPNAPARPRAGIVVNLRA